MAGRPLPEMMRLSARVPRGEAGFWQIMLRLDRAGPWSVQEVEDQSNVGPGAVAQYLRKLVRGGYARQVGERPAPVRPQKTYRLAKRPSEAPRLAADGGDLGKTARERMWTAMRSLRQFTVAELAYAASLDRSPVKPASAQRYVECLAEAGYLILLVGGSGGVYSLKPAMNSGPWAPAILRLNVVFDRNWQKPVGDATAGEIAP